ncbi:melanocortin-2 receptor accessory protein isoform 1-T1 [Spheniscus humboldti]
METASSWYFYASFSKYQWENSELQVIKKTPREIIPHLMEDLFYLRQYLSLESMTLLFHLSLNSIVIAFWVGLAAFVTFLFLILLYMSRSGSTPVKSGFRLKLLSQLRGAKGVLPVERFSLRPIWLRAVLLLQQEAYASYAPSPVKSSVLLT